MDDTKITQAALADSIGYTQRAVSKWVNEQAEPSGSAICAVAAFFHVTPDFLLGYDELGAVLIPSSSHALSTDEREILKLYQALSPTRKEDLKIYLRALSGNSASTTKKKA